MLNSVWATFAYTASDEWDDNFSREKCYPVIDYFDKEN